MRLLVENDQRAIEQIRHLITWWSHVHHFWQTIILSSAALRKKWDQLVAQLKQEREGRGEQVHHLPKRRVEEFKLNLTKGEAKYSAIGVSCPH